MNKAPLSNLLIVSMVAGLLWIPVQATEGSLDNNLLEIVRKYVVARNATMQQGAKPESVDAVLSFCADDVSYEHPRVKIKIQGKGNIRQGMVAFLRTTRDPGTEFLNHIAIQNLVVVEFNRTFKAKQDDVWKEFERRQVMMFEFEGNKIKRIVDYW